MKRKLPIAGAIGAILMASLTTTPVFARAATQAVSPENDARKAQMKCIWEAKWPLRHSTAYRVGDVRTKNQIRNSSTPEVRKMQSVCRALTSTSEAEKRKARLTCHDLLLVILDKYPVARRDAPELIHISVFECMRLADLHSAPPFKPSRLFALSGRHF